MKHVTGFAIKGIKHESNFPSLAIYNLHIACSLLKIWGMKFTTFSTITAYVCTLTHIIHTVGYSCNDGCKVI